MDAIKEQRKQDVTRHFIAGIEALGRLAIYSPCTARTIIINCSDNGRTAVTCADLIRVINELDTNYRMGPWMRDPDLPYPGAARVVNRDDDMKMAAALFYTPMHRNIVFRVAGYGQSVGVSTQFARKLAHIFRICSKLATEHMIKTYYSYLYLLTTRCAHCAPLLYLLGSLVIHVYLHIQRSLPFRDE